jgi:hypothetical protein
VRQADRKREREARRREQQARDRAARVIQQVGRRYIDWRERRSERRRRDSLAAIAIQHAFRSRAEVWHAKRELQALRLLQLERFVVRLQRVARRFLLQVSARRELERRRKSKQMAEQARRAAEEGARSEAAAEIQRAVRGYVARRRLQRQLSGTSSIGGDSVGGASARGHDFGDRDVPGGGPGNRSGSRGRNIARRTLVAALQPGGGGAGRRKRERSIARIQIK